MELKRKMTKREAGRLGNERMKIVAAEARQKKIAEYNLHPKLCEQCGGPIPYRGKYLKGSRFCSSSCAAKFNNSRRDPSFMTESIRQKISDGVRKFYGNAPRSVTRYCKCCGKPLNSDNKFFCSNSCQANYAWNMKKDEIRRTGLFPSTTHNETDRKSARRYIEENVGHHCAICGLEQWRGQPAPLVVDHIDGNATNHKVENLRLVCPNCDAQLPTFKNKPHEAHRDFRRKDYVPDLGIVEMVPIGFDYQGLTTKNPIFPESMRD